MICCIIINTICLYNKILAQTGYPFQDTTLTDDQRLDNLLSLMTQEEKLNALATQFGVPRLGIKNCMHSEGLHGLAYGGPSNWGSRRPVPSTIFPQSYGLAETWDEILVYKVACQEAYENRYYFQSPKYYRGSLVMRAPNADLGRDPRWGRTEECFGEDAYLTSRMTVAFVKGLQGNHPKYWCTASLMKHFMANSNEDGRDSTSSDFGEKLFREYYGYPFYKGITEGGSKAFMASYNAYNGLPMTTNPLLKQIAVNEWGNNGIICTDGGALDLLVTAHKAYPDIIMATVACLKAGITQFLDTYKPYVKEALKLGLISETDIDEAVRKNFYIALKLGLLDNSEDNPYTYIGVKDTIDPWTSPETHKLVREVTAKSVVLLKNNKGLLPVDRQKIKRIAVIGPRANDVVLDWYSGMPPYTVSVLEGIRNAVDEGTEVNYAADNRMDQAYGIAQKADMAIVVIGNHPYGTDAKWAYAPVPSDGREAVDRKSLSLEQEDLVKIVYAANPNTVLILVSSFPFTINWSQQNIPAILHVTHCSQELGNGLADVLFGTVNPAGRLVQTWPASIDQLPPIMDYDITNGRTYMYTCKKPLYPFGYGLSYASFDYSGIRLDKNAFASQDDRIIVSASIKNVSATDGEEVIQLYVSYGETEKKLPLRQLKGFKRIMIKAGETLDVQIPLKAEDLVFWDEVRHQFVTYKGPLKIMLGSSSEDIRLSKKIQISNKF
ncbi:MAG: glycoside hydrolase family 3 C-terminal domain-containing protein [Bacteroidales bacterium]|nr:glycoside hydrolase family 3 C-terminal domain-containing protein [Bacteroidales bacterium]